MQWYSEDVIIFLVSEDLLNQHYAAEREIISKK